MIPFSNQGGALKWYQTRIASLHCNVYKNILRSAAIKTSGMKIPLKPICAGDYIQFNCSLTDKNCLPCRERLPSCSGLPDGKKGFLSRSASPEYIECFQNRTISVGKCWSGDYDEEHRQCNGFVYGAIPLGYAQAVCNDDLVSGLNGIPDTKITASSEFGVNDPTHDYSAPRGRLNTTEVTDSSGIVHIGSWTSEKNDVNQWLQFELNEPSLIRGITTQGRNGCCKQWVTKFRVLYSMDCKNWTQVGGHNVSNMIFKGNSDEDTPESNVFDCPVIAKCIRINPQDWNHHISLRAEIHGCPLPSGQAQTTTATTSVTTGAGTTSTVASTTTGAMTTQPQTTGVITTQPQTTGVVTTLPQTSGALTTQTQTTGTATTQTQNTGAVTTQSQTTGAATTQSQTTGVATTQSQTTGAATAQSQTTGAATTQSQTTGAATTQSQTTGAATTQSQTTGAATTQSQTTGAATSQSQTTGAATTQSQTTGAATTHSQTTGAATTQSQTTGAATTHPLTTTGVISMTTTKVGATTITASATATTTTTSAIGSTSTAGKLDEENANYRFVSLEDDPDLVPVPGSWAQRVVRLNLVSK
ncbi:hypothetical protein CHS0354_004011 [Potamilus streckersoni]|uniref:F5/8 type C domain-containing protein n=1 Tax=Potamilus streckersoni TaxID=2493646 RepID=A0AAE0VMH0_9BIVA|nr:hypothetical protein CHS0354_004011 [Potamilus streckersoni]